MCGKHMVCSVGDSQSNYMATLLLSCGSSENAGVMLGKMMKYMAVQSDKADTNVSHHTMTAGFFFVQRL